MMGMSWAASSREQNARIYSPVRDSRRGWLIASIFFVGLLGWAAMTPLDAGAIAHGVIAVSGSRQLVQHRDGGIVTQINVTEGQAVNKGDLLVRISTPEVAASERGMTAEMVTLLAQQARLSAERDGGAQVVEPLEYLALDQSDRVLANQAIADERGVFAARRAAAASEHSVLEQRARQYDAQILAFNRQISAKKEQSRLITAEKQGMESLVSRGFVSTNRIRAMERSAAELDGDIGALSADIARSSEAIGEARMQSVSLDRKMQEDVSTQLRDIQLRLGELRPKLFSVREQLSRSLVRAPATGKVVGLRVHTVGGIVSGGETLMEIVPTEKKFVIEAKASPNDADDLEIGMATQVRFSALGVRNLPILSGKISKVSADSFEDDRTRQRYFAIEVTIPPSELAKIGQSRGDNALKVGLPAEVLVPLRKRTALGYLLEPLKQSVWMAGREH